MIVNLQIGVWMGYRLDKEESRKVTESNGADADAARVNKHIIPKEDMKAITAAGNQVRTHFYTNTLPWKDNGDRLLTRKRYMPFIETHEKLVGNFKDAVNEFVNTLYPRAVARAEFRMGSLFKEDDYPEARELQRKFYCNLDIDAVTMPEMLKGCFEDKEAYEKAKADAEAAMQARTVKAVGSLWGQLAEMLSHLGSKLADENAIFRDSTITNLQELVDMMPDLNFTNDPNLTRIANEIEQTMLGYEVKDLRKDGKVRKAAALDAKKILDDMGGFMAAFTTP
jgi:hypothetical protein